MVARKCRLSEFVPMEHIGHVGFWIQRLSVSGYRGCQFKPRHQCFGSLSKTLYLHCFSRLSCEMSTRWGQLRKGCLQCYELFGGMTLKNHAFLSCYWEYNWIKDILVFSLSIQLIHETSIIEVFIVVFLLLRLPTT